MTERCPDLYIIVEILSPGPGFTGGKVSSSCCNTALASIPNNSSVLREVDITVLKEGRHPSTACHRKLGRLAGVH